MHSHGGANKVSSIGIIQFWTDPARPPSEVRRVLRPGGSMLMLCLAPKQASDFVQPEYGFHLRDAATWDPLCRAPGFAGVDVETTESDQITPSGVPIKRFEIIVRAGV